MNENEFDRVSRAWLDDGPTRMSDRAVLFALDEIHTTRQLRAPWPAWRAAPVSMFARVSAAAVLVVAVSLVGITVVPSVGGPSPSASPAQAVDFPGLTTTFVSPRNGFSVRHPDRVSLKPATNLWGFGDDGVDVVETGLAAVFEGSSIEMPVVQNDVLVGQLPGTSIDEWVDQAVEDADGCAGPRSQQAEITIDGQSGRIAECPNQTDATVVAGERLYLFTLLSDRADARGVFDAFAATIELTPETAVHGPKLDTTFVSPTNGFSVRFYDRGGLEPAKELWDPVGQPFVGSYPLEDDGFDFIETGFGYGLLGASTEIPDGVSIDDWIDAAVVTYLPGGCSVARSQQAVISIDGQSGRISEDCPDKVAATVVAGGRLYLFILAHNTRGDARALFDEFAATIDLRPEDVP
jgi:hypothetical protein